MPVKPKRHKPWNQTQPQEKPFHHLYSNTRWQKARARFLRHYPLCVMCQKEGRITPATVVDHIEPHKGDEEKFWDESNWQPLCAIHHNSHKKIIEGGKSVRKVGVDGYPVGGGMDR